MVYLRVNSQALPARVTEIMLGRHPEQSVADGTPTSGERVRLVVYHHGQEIERLIEQLRPAQGLEIELIRKGTLWTVPSDADALLWELAPEDGFQRLISALIGGLPAASFCTSTQPGMKELSKALGFREHLPTPLRLEDVERALGMADAIDLADRLDTAAPALREMATRPEVIAAFVRAVNTSSDPADVSRAVTDRLMQWLPLDAWHLLSVEADGELHWPGELAPEAGPRQAIESFAEVVVQTGQPAVRVTNYIDERSGAAAGARSIEASALGWPLVANGAVVGAVVGMDAGRARRMPRLSADLADAMARLIEPAAFAMAHAIRVARAEALSVTDDLTQLYNSRFLNDALRKETKRAMRSGWSLSLLFIDLDGFKRINDAHGHLLGSRALIEAAEIIASCGRETDIVARFGGDEFAILLPETATDGAQSVARRIRDRIERHDFLADRGPGIRISASIGLATLPEIADSAEGLLQAADAAMYHVKMSGKNGIHVAGSEPRSEPRSAPLREEKQELR
jgi:diguanylate cyclase (GGDEF)-like protein